MKTLRKPDNAAELDFYIYNCGLEAALKMFGLTEAQAERILFKAPIKPNTKIRIQECIFLVPEINHENLRPLYDTLKKHYVSLRKKFVGVHKNRINKHSNSPEDTFHNCLLKMFENSETFQFTSEDSALAYISSKLYLNRRAENTKLFRDKKQFTDIFPDVPADEIIFYETNIHQHAHNLLAASKAA